jgi:hypothetical protein
VRSRASCTEPGAARAAMATSHTTIVLRGSTEEESACRALVSMRGVAPDSPSFIAQSWRLGNLHIPPVSEF